MNGCGTYSAYQKHRRAGETPCDACRQAATEYRRRYPRTKEPQERAWKARDAILDWLNLDGGWLTSDGLALDLGRNRQAVERVLRQLRDEGLVESRILVLSSSGTGQARTEWRLP